MGLLVLLLVLCSYKRGFYAQQCEYKKWKLNPLSRDIHLHIPRLQCQKSKLETFEIVVLSVGTLL